MALVTVGWSNSDLNEKLPKTDYESKRYNIRVEHKLQTIQLPPGALALGARLRRPGVWKSVIFHVDLLTNEAMFMGWNPSGIAVYLEMYDFWCSWEHNSQWNQALFGLECLFFSRRRFSYISILTGYRSLKMGVQNCHNTAGLLWPKWNTSWKHD